MLDAKHEAHEHYEKIRTQLPALRGQHKVNAAVLEDYIMCRLNTSALDTAVAALSQKAGASSCIHLLAQHLESEANADREINFQNLDALPAGLSEVYAVNFKARSPTGGGRGVDPTRAAAHRADCGSAGADHRHHGGHYRVGRSSQSAALEATSLLFPVREGKFHVFHKTVVDWLTGDIGEGGSVTRRSEIPGAQRRHAALAAGRDVARRRT